MEFSAKQIAEFIHGVIVGDENATVHTFAKIEEGVPGAISFLSNPKYTHYIYNTKSSIVLVNKDFVPEKEISATLIKVDNAYEESWYPSIGFHRSDGKGRPECVCRSIRLHRRKRCRRRRRFHLSSRHSVRECFHRRKQHPLSQCHRIP